MPVISHESVRRDTGTPEAIASHGAYEARLYSDTGGLTQFGAFIEELAPGSRSSNRHWHEAQDEFLWMLTGEATLHENRGSTLLRPGAAVAWPMGVANAHCLENTSDAPCSYLIVGTRGGDDVVHYPDHGEKKLIPEGGARQMLPEDVPAPADLPSAVLDLAAAPVKTGSIYPEPYAAMMAGRASLRLGQMGGLTQFGANLVTLQPGAVGSLRHWHEREDEFLIVTEGALVLVDDAGENPMAPGDIAAFPAGEANGHHMTNPSEAPASFLVIGTKAPSEVAHYADHDFRIEIEGSNARFTYRDGSPWNGLRRAEKGDTA
ncbi:cupin domain-containing protein [Oceanicola sp. 502str15]|uniref:cupin domain-containing protein n=1 Tax=Oceanicola sp. 502str15 TaxID=2696061 RepID=UPI0033800D15|nr:cupin domain-containing protein [Oceanicola sp. 502str15]